MSTWIQRVPLVGLLLSLLTVAATVSSVGPDHLVLALVLACGLTLATSAADTPLVPRLVSVHRRSQVRSEVGVRSVDPDRSGGPRPRAPSLGF